MNITPPPSPGSKEAIAMGCSCPVLDNGHGYGSYYGKDVFIYSTGCTVHDEDEDVSER